MKCSIKRCTAEAYNYGDVYLCPDHEQTLRRAFYNTAKAPDAPPPTLGSLLGALANGEVPQSDVIRSFVDNAMKARAVRAQARQAASPPHAQPQRTPTQAALMVLGFDPRKPAPSAEVIKDRFRNLAKTYHPDRPAGDAKKMQAINKAYEILTTPR